MEMVLAGIGTVALLGFVAFLVLRSEIRKEDRPPPRRSAHDDAYGKGPGFQPQGDSLRTGGRSRDFGDGDVGGD